MKRLKRLVAALAAAAGPALCPAGDSPGDRVNNPGEFPGAVVEVPEIPASDDIDAFRQVFHWKGRAGARVFTPVIHTLQVGKPGEWSAPVGARVEYFAGKEWRKASPASWKLDYTPTRGDLKLKLLPAGFGDGLPSSVCLVLATEHGLYAPSEGVLLGGASAIVQFRRLAYVQKLKDGEPYDSGLLNLRAFTSAAGGGEPQLWEQWDARPVPNASNAGSAPHLAVPGCAPWPVWVDLEAPRLWFLVGNSFKAQPPARSDVTGRLSPDVPEGVRATVTFGKMSLTVESGRAIDLQELCKKVIGNAPPMVARTRWSAFEREAELVAMVPPEWSHLWEAGPAIKLGFKNLRVQRGALVNTVKPNVKPRVHRRTLSSLPPGAVPTKARATFTIGGKSLSAAVTADGALRWRPEGKGGVFELRPGLLGQAEAAVTLHVERCKDKTLKLDAATADGTLILDPLGVRVTRAGGASAEGVEWWLHKPGAGGWSKPVKATVHPDTPASVFVEGPEGDLTGWLLEMRAHDQAPVMRRMDGADLNVRSGGEARTVILNDHRASAFAAPGLNDAVRAVQEGLLEKLDEGLGGAKGAHRFLALSDKGHWPAQAPEARRSFLRCQGPLPPPVPRQRLPREGFWERVRDVALEPELRTGGPLCLIVVTVLEGELGQGIENLKNRVAHENGGLKVVPVVVGPASDRTDALKRSLPNLIYVPVSVDDKNIDARIDEAVKLALKTAAR